MRTHHHPLQTFWARLWWQYLSPLEAFSHIYLCPELHAADLHEEALLSADPLLPVATAAQ